MKSKLFEIRDDGTFIPVMATRIKAKTISEQFLLSRAGYQDSEARISLWRMDGSGSGKATSDICDWQGSRTMKTAHHYIQRYWRMLKTGDVIDVEFILGETSTKKISESNNE